MQVIEEGGVGNRDEYASVSLELTGSLVDFTHT